MLQEFKTFIARGNVFDLAVGVIIGAAFGGIVTSLTESIIMPLISAVFGQVDFTNWFIRLGPIPEGYEGAADNYIQLREAGVPMLGYGDFLTQLLNFLIVAFALFLLIKSVNRVIEESRKKQKEAEETATEEEAATDPQLDVLKQILAELRSNPADGATPTGGTGGAAGGGATPPAG